MSALMPYSGQAMSHRALAQFDVPRHHLRFAEQGAHQGRILVSGQWNPPTWDGPVFDATVPERRQRIAQGIRSNDHAGLLSDLAAVTDTLSYLETALEEADSIPELAADRPAYASFRHQYRAALLQWSEKTRTRGRLAKAERRFRGALDIRGAGTAGGALTRSELVRLELIRHEMGAEAAPGDGGGNARIATALEEAELLWWEFGRTARSGLFQARLLAVRSRVAAAAAGAGHLEPAEETDRDVAEFLASPRFERLPRARAELFVERARLVRARRPGGEARGMVAAFVDSALALVPADQYPGLAREAHRLLAG